MPWGTAGHCSSCTVSDSHVSEKDWIPHFWFWPDPVLAVSRVWENELADRFPSGCLSYEERHLFVSLLSGCLCILRNNLFWGSSHLVQGIKLPCTIRAPGLISSLVLVLTAPQYWLGKAGLMVQAPAVPATHLETCIVFLAPGFCHPH